MAKQYKSEALAAAHEAAAGLAEAGLMSKRTMRAFDEGSERPVEGACGSARWSTPATGSACRSASRRGSPFCVATGGGAGFRNLTDVVSCAPCHGPLPRPAADLEPHADLGRRIGRAVDTARGSVAADELLPLPNASRARAPRALGGG